MYLAQAHGCPKRVVSLPRPPSPVPEMTSLDGHACLRALRTELRAPCEISKSIHTHVNHGDDIQHTPSPGLLLLLRSASHSPSITEIKQFKSCGVCHDGRYWPAQTQRHLRQGPNEGGGRYGRVTGYLTPYHTHPTHNHPIHIVLMEEGGDGKLGIERHRHRRVRL